MKKRKSVWRQSIYRKYVSWGRLQTRGMKFKWERSFKHWPHSSPCQWVPEIDCLCASAIFVSGTSGIMPILYHRSVSPIDAKSLGTTIQQKKRHLCFTIFCQNTWMWSPAPKLYPNVNHHPLITYNTPHHRDILLLSHYWWRNQLQLF